MRRGFRVKLGTVFIYMHATYDIRCENGTLHFEIGSAYIYLIISQPLRFDNYTKPCCDINFILIYHATLVYACLTLHHLIAI